MIASKNLRLPKAAARLLEGLAPTGAYAIADPAVPGTVILRAARAGISLGAGRFDAAAAEDLARRDLAAWSRGGGRDRLEISAAGRPHLRRAEAGADTPAFLAQHLALDRGVMDVAGARETVMLDRDESPLGWLRMRKDAEGRPFLDPAAIEAGERLRSDLTLAGILRSVTVRWGPAVDRGDRRSAVVAGAATETMVAARQRVTRALRAVGEDFADVLIDVCGFLKRLEVVERERGWPVRSGKVVVRLALWRLAEHYGLEREARGPAESHGIRVWRELALAE